MHLFALIAESFSSSFSTTNYFFPDTDILVTQAFKSRYLTLFI